MAHCVCLVKESRYCFVTPWALAGHGVEITAIHHHILDEQTQVAVWYLDAKVIWHMNTLKIDMDSYGQEIPVPLSRSHWSVPLMDVGYGDETKLLALVTCSW